MKNIQPRQSLKKISCDIYYGQKVNYDAEKSKISFNNLLIAPQLFHKCQSLSEINPRIYFS